jgi:hypothetical protein
VTDKAAAAVVTAGEVELEVQAGLGFRAALVDEQLVITQAGEPKDDNVTLSKSEAYVLFAKFARWAGIALSNTTEG